MKWCPQYPVHVAVCKTLIITSPKYPHSAKLSVQVDSTDFHVEKSITASGTEAVIEVLFEPPHLGDSQATLSLSSTQGGDYTIPLFGHCLPPRPQGPYTLKVGQSISIPFKNVFPQTMQFSYSINSPAFSVRAPETLKARKTCNMQVIQPLHTLHKT